MGNNWAWINIQLKHIWYAQGCITLVDLIGGGLDIPISYKYTLNFPPTEKIKTFFQSMIAT